MPARPTAPPGWRPRRSRSPPIPASGPTPSIRVAPWSTNAPPPGRCGADDRGRRVGARHRSGARRGAFNTAVQEAGAFVTAGGLHPPSSATTVDYTGDSPVLTPGPFVEAKEYLGGFWIIEAENDDVAIEWTKQASRALRSRVEVRALQEAPQD
ncbi:YciI family protein [Amycolatopsis coloradensis]|uniref:YciI family protein n=1 Tax=Amycolatopsis coloradensis TaxID=76021 RepID=A0ACD5B3X1_9PSEU